MPTKRVSELPVLNMDQAHYHHDIHSDDMRRVHPDLPLSPLLRLQHQQRCDARAYRAIRETFPRFTPPSSASHVKQYPVVDLPEHGDDETHDERKGLLPGGK